MRKVIAGFVCGVLSSVFVTVFAMQMDVAENPFRILVNGQETAIAGYNIDGSSYFKLRDIGNAIGFDVDFANETIIMNNKVGQPPSKPNGTVSDLGQPETDNNGTSIDNGIGVNNGNADNSNIGTADDSANENGQTPVNEINPAEQ